MFCTKLPLLEKLENLDLAQNDFAIEQVRKLASAIEKMPALTNVDVSKNTALQREGVKILQGIRAALNVVTS